GMVPPPNIGPRSIDASGIGLGMTYKSIMKAAQKTISSGETVFCGPVDDPFFVDLAGAFDLGNFRYAGNPDNVVMDRVSRHNVHSIVLRIPISKLLKSSAASKPASILDGDYVIGVWASASRPSMKTLSTVGDNPTYNNTWVQVSRLGMPLTNE